MKPILFSADMVRAILDGRKAVTRRVVKPQPKGRLVPMGNNSCWPGYFAIQGTENVICPPYHPSDNLWVRETWQVARGGGYIYKADTIGSHDLFISPDGRVVNDIPWRPSIHMPREAARIFLQVKEVRVERLKDITPEQIDAEGCKEWACSAITGEPLPSGPSWFKIAWDRTIKPSDLPVYGWEANPWVWVIEFERISRPPEGEA